MKTYIWSLPTRLFHWLLAIGFTVAYILGDFDNLENWHFAFGALVGALIFFRLLFGLFGPKYSNFKDFPIALKNQKEFIRSYFSKSKTYVGHNPVASVVMLLILIIGILCSISGYLLYAAENNVLSSGINEGLLEESHEFLANIFLVLVGIHLFGVLSDTLFHRKTGTIQSIFTGNKNIESKNIHLNGFHITFSLLWFIIPAIVFYLAYGLQNNETKKENRIESREYHGDDD